MFLNDDTYRQIAEHGYRFLRDTMWDVTHGGFHMLLDRKGELTAGSRRGAKSAYGNAFAIYALATYFRMSGDTSALNLARRTFHWLDQHSRDPEYKGYFDALTADGTWLYTAGSDRSSGFLARAEWKDQNSSIHLLEAFTALYSVWPDELLRERFLELLLLIRDTITTEKGYLILFLERDWTPVSFRDSSDAVRKANFHHDHVSFGHDVETAFLMLEASHTLGLKNDTRTLTVARRMVDHALAKGWDDELGGFYEGGYYFDESDDCTIVDDRKTWWVQAEGLNALLLMARLFPDEKKYYRAFEQQWAYIKAYLIDHEYGGWYREGLDNSPELKTAAKGSDWKINYHNMRALMNCIKMLKGEDALTGKHVTH
jgi:mannobiose 2-epimerase